MWTREAISPNIERHCRGWIMRHNQPLKVLLTSELLTLGFSGGAKRRQLHAVVRHRPFIACEAS